MSKGGVRYNGQDKGDHLRTVLRQSFGNYTYAAAQLGSGRILRRAALRLRLW